MPRGVRCVALPVLRPVQLLGVALAIAVDDTLTRPHQGLRLPDAAHAEHDEDEDARRAVEGGSADGPAEDLHGGPCKPCILFFYLDSL